MMDTRPIFINARFRSGSTLLWNFFHQIPEAHAYYEPLHEQLPELITRNIAPQVRHFNVESYFNEYPEIADLTRHHRPEFGLLNLYLEKNNHMPDLKNYLNYLINYPDKTKVPVFQFNRIDFRLPWIRHNFPGAILIHLFRSPRDQWISTISDNSHEIDINIDSDAYRIATWSRDLCQQFPFLATPFIDHAYQRFYYLWKLSFLAGKRFSDLSIAYEDFLVNPSKGVITLLDFVELDSPENVDVVKNIVVSRPMDIWKNYRSHNWFQELEDRCEACLDVTGLNEYFGKQPLEEIIASNSFYNKMYDDFNIDAWVHKTSQLTILNLLNLADQKETIIGDLSSSLGKIQKEAGIREQVIVTQKDQLLEQQIVISSQKDQLLDRERVIVGKEQTIQSFRTSLGFWLRHGPLRYVPFLRPIVTLIILIRGFFRPKIGVLEQHPPKALRIPRSYDLHSMLNPNDAPIISIVTPSFNQAKFIKRTVESVLRQDYPNLEYIVQDGLSTDNTVNILEPYIKNLAHFESHKDRGQAHAVNLGFQHANGEIMAYLNSDDILLPGSLWYIANYFYANPAVDVVYSHRVIINEHDDEVGRWILPPHDPQILQWADYVPQETMFWRKEIWEKAGGQMDESFQFALDWDLLIRFQSAGANIVRVPRFIGAFRLHETQKTSAQINEQGLDEMNRVRRGIHGRHITWNEVEKNTRKYLRKSVAYHKLYRLGIFRF